MSHEKLLSSLSKKIINTRNDIFELKQFSNLFFETADIIESNPNIKIQTVDDIRSEENHFIYYFFKTFLQYSSIAIRRHSRYNHYNDNSSSRSLIHLLKKMERNDKAISRQWYLDQVFTLYSSHPDFDKVLFLHEAESQFDRISSYPNLEHLCPKIVNADITALEQLTSPICDYVDKNIAHLEIAEQVKVPSYSDVKESILFLTKLTEKYIFFFVDSGIDIKKLNSDAWKKCLTFPWIAVD